MCTPKNIKLILMIMNGFKAFASVVFIFYGLDLVTNWDYQRAYSTSIEGYGLGIMIVGAISPFSTICAYLGSKQHNKFLLTVHAVLDYTFFSIQLFFIGSINSYLVAEYDSTTRTECMSMDGRYNGDYPDECPVYYLSERYAKMHLTWVGKFEAAMYDSAQYTALKSVQILGGCCGFGLPGTCEENDNEYPGGLQFNSIPEKWLVAVTQCDAEVDDFRWYVASGSGAYQCDHYIDPTIADPILGGCEYEMPIGECMNQDPSVSGFEFRGCANMFEDMLDEAVSGMTGIMTMCTCLFAISATFACCHCWKRKETDVLPNYIIDIPWDPDDPKNFKAKSKIMDEFDEEDAAAEKKEEDDKDLEEDD